MNVAREVSKDRQTDVDEDFKWGVSECVRGGMGWREGYHLHRSQQQGKLPKVGTACEKGVS